MVPAEANNRTARTDWCDPGDQTKALVPHSREGIPRGFTMCGGESGRLGALPAAPADASGRARLWAVLDP